MVLYQGYAQARGFDPVNIPDPSRKIRQQGLQQLEGMERQLAWKNKQTNRLVTAMEQNAAFEAKNREDNHRLRMMYRDTLAKNKWKQFEQIIKNEGTYAKQRENDLMAILSLTKSGAQLVNQYQEKRNDDIDAFARDLNDQYGIGIKKYQQVKSFDKHMWEEGMKTEGFLSSHGLDHVPEHVLNRIRKQGGYAGLRVAEMSALRLSKSMRGKYADDWGKTVKIGDMDVSLETAGMEQIDEVLRQLNREYRKDLGEAWPSSNVWESSGAWKNAEKAKAWVRRKKEETEIAEARIETKQTNWEIIEHQMNRDNGVGDRAGVQGIQNSIVFLAGGEDAPPENFKRAKGLVVDALIHGLENDLIEWNDVKDLELLDFEMKGQKQIWGNVFKPEWARIERAGLKAAKDQYQRARIGEFEREAEDVEMKENMINLMATEGADIPTLQKFLTIANKNNFTKSQTYIQKQLSTGLNTFNDKQNLAILRARKARNEIITPEEIDSMNLSDGARSLAKSEAAKNNIYLPQAGKNGNKERLEERIQRELEFIIPKSNSYSSNASHKDAALKAYEMASGYYKEAKLANKSDEEAYKYARDLITQDIRDEDGIFGKGEINADGTREFKGFQANMSRVQLPNTVAAAQKLVANPDLIYNQPFIAKEDIASKSARLNKGLASPMLPQSELLRSVAGISTIDSEMAQLEYWRNKEIEETGSSNIQPYPDSYVKKAKDAEGLIKPKARYLLNSYNYTDINKASMISENGVIYNAPLLKKVETIGKRVSNDDYDFTDKGNSLDTYGFNLTNFSLREVMSYQESGQVIQLGAYQLTMDQIKQGAELANIPYDHKFSRENQDKLFEVLIRTNNWVAPEDLSEQEQLLLEDTQETLKDDKISSNWGFHSPSYLSKEAYDYLFTGGRYVTA